MVRARATPGVSVLRGENRVAPDRYKSWLHRQLELGGAILLAIVMLPLILVLLRPLLMIVALLIVIVIAARGFGGYIAARRNRW